LAFGVWRSAFVLVLVLALALALALALEKWDWASGVFGVLREVPISPRNRGVRDAVSAPSQRDDANKFSEVLHRSGAFV
jgi:hypothetical protein